MLLFGRRRGYASSAARNVSDHASSASTGPRTARHTRSTVGPCSATISSKGFWLTLGKRRSSAVREVDGQLPHGPSALLTAHRGRAKDELAPPLSGVPPYNLVKAMS